MLKFFRLPFATTGDKTAVPDAVDSNGNVSYSQGYGFDYQRQKTDPAAKNIERDKMNQILFDITTAIAELQSKGGADFITSALNGGTAYSYGQGAIVNYGGAWYISLAAANTALPTDATKWAYLPTPALLQQAAFMRANAGGTVDAITAAFTPAIAALPAAPGTLSVFVRATGANTSTTPTFKADGTAVKTIVKGANQALVAGDIAGAGHWLELQYDATLDKWVLLNPYVAGGIPTAVAAGTADAITADFTPNVALTNGTTVIVRAGAANTTTTPTFAPDGLTAKTIVKGNNLALVAGDIAGAGHWLEMSFDTVLDKWVLQNPYGSVTFASADENAAGTIENKAVDPLGIREAFNASGSAPIYACRAWVNFNGTGTVAIRAAGNVSSITDNGTGDYTVNFTTAIQDVNYSVVALSRRSTSSNLASVNIFGSATSMQTTSVRIAAQDSGSTLSDSDVVCVSIFR